MRGRWRRQRGNRSLTVAARMRGGTRGRYRKWQSRRGGNGSDGFLSDFGGGEDGADANRAARGPVQGEAEDRDHRSEVGGRGGGISAISGHRPPTGAAKR